MTRPVNIYNLSRIKEEETFNLVERHFSQPRESHRTQYHEIESLRRLADELKKNGVSVTDMDCFFFSYHIPQIGKEFDLLKFTKKICLNIELKSGNVTEEKILEQLLKNRHYLSHLGKRLMLFTVVTDTMACYKLSGDQLVRVRIDDLVGAVRRVSFEYTDTIDELFRAAEYLVSPLNTPVSFIKGEYFLTQGQEQIKKSILKGIDETSGGICYHLTGRPGTGKTLLLYDLGKTLAEKGETLIIHCGKLSAGQYKIRKTVSGLNIISVSLLQKDYDLLKDYRYILVDETHRIYPDQFEKICESVRTNDQVCIFSSDPEQILSETEKQNDIVSLIKAIPPLREFVMSEKIRTNKELYSFITNMRNLNHRAKTVMDYSDVDLNYANTTAEAQNMLEYYRKKRYTFINYSKSNYEESPYSAYEEDFDTHHVIGQEFDRVVMLMDSSFFYDENGELQGIRHPNPDYLYPNLFYQGITRVREKLALIVVQNAELFRKVATIVKREE